MKYENKYLKIALGVFSFGLFMGGLVVIYNISPQVGKMPLIFIAFKLICAIALIFLSFLTTRKILTNDISRSFIIHLFFYSFSALVMLFYSSLPQYVCLGMGAGC